MATRRITTESTEIADGEEAVHTETRVQKAAPFAAANQFIYLMFGIVDALLLLRFLFKMAGASRAAGFVRFLYGFTDVLMAPFRLIFPVSVSEGAVVEWSVLVAIAIYTLIAWVLVQLVGIFWTAEQAE